MLSAFYDHNDIVVHSACSNTAFNNIICAISIYRNKFTLNIVDIRFSGVGIKSFAPGKIYSYITDVISFRQIDVEVNSYLVR